MARRYIVTLAIVGAALGVVPARAYSTTVSQKTLTFSALPCSLACGYGDLDAGDDYACNDPMVPGSFADHVVKVPSKANYLIFRATPTIDWDLFVCRSGKVLRYSATRYLNTIAEQETIGMYVKPGVSYRLRAYNERDVEDLTATVMFRYVKF